MFALIALGAIIYDYFGRKAETKPKNSLDFWLIADG